MKKGLQLVVFLLIYTLTVNSQVNRHGTPLIGWFDAAQTPGELRNLCITMDHSGVMYFGNEAGGIVTYDGSRWGLIRTPGTTAITSLVTDARGIVFAGGKNDFGMLQPDDAGRMTYRSLAARTGDSLIASSIGIIKASAADSNAVFFTDGKRLYCLNGDDDSVMVADMETDYGFRNLSALVAFDNRIIIADDREGIFAYSEGRIDRIAGGDAMVPARFVKLIPYDRDNLLVGSSGKELMLFNIRTGALNERFSDKAAASLMKNGSLSDLALIPGNMIAAGFKGRGGIYIFSRDGALVQHISERTTALRESSVTAMYCDYKSNSQLWFCTRGYINRAFVSLPATEFSQASGLIPVPGTITGHAGSVYAGTDNGLYVNYTDGSGTRRFRRAGDHNVTVNAIINAELSEGVVLIAATVNGLLQVDDEGYLDHFLPGIAFSAVREAGDKRDVMVAGSGDGIVRTLKYDGYEWVVTHTIAGEFAGTIRYIEQTSPDEWWIMTENPSALLRMNCHPDDTTFFRFGREQGLDCDTLNGITIINETLYLCSGRGIYRYIPDNDAFARDHELVGDSFDDVSIKMISAAPGGEIILSGYDARNFDALVTSTSQGHVVFRRQFDFLPDIATAGIAFAEGTIWLSKGQSLFVLDKSKLAFRYGSFKTVFTQIISGRGNVIMDGTFYTIAPGRVRVPVPLQPPKPGIILSHRENNITFRWTTTSYVEEEKTEYRHRLEGFNEEWSGWEIRNYRDYTNLPSGDYRFVLRAKTITGLEGEELAFSFSVSKPWYRSTAAILVYSAVAAWLIFMLIRDLARRLGARKRRLESLLRQRNEATARGRNEITELENYAGVVQQAVIPSEEKLAKAIPGSFVLNRPKGSVSGDFFWMVNQGERLTMAVGDCTGHGVASSFRTITALCFLEDIAADSGPVSTSEMLSEFRKKLSDTFRRLPARDIHLEGIDISLLTIDRSANTIEFSGAASQCFRVREMSDHERARWDNGEFKPNEGTMVSGKYLLETVYGDRIPLGMHLNEDHVFTQHRWKLEKESSYYLFTDGYSDQFNGATGKKFLRKHLRRLILDIQNYHMSKQKEILEERLVTWMGKSPQTDDILIVGIRIE
ncbi:MAG: SpoIIE family protein phosphatase [Bacteroidales bacterium]|jgi:outer membrane protein assembly factor BamB|nr:SpoIIE family protein phosphatase [Bacteroidales bacterium]